MSFMQNEITDAKQWVRVETDWGTEFVPADVLADCPNKDEVYDDEHVDFDYFKDALRDYVTAEITEMEVVTGYGARLSAPGYMDCTDWCVFDDQQEAEEYLEDTYGE